MAARDASEASSKWITIGKYGAGANPILDGTSTQQFGIDLSGVGKNYRGGWKVANVNIKNYTVAAIRAETSSINGARGLWITGPTIDNITGVSFDHTTHVLTPPIAGYSHFTALGVDSSGIRNAFFDNLTITNTDTPYWNVSGDDSVVDAVTTSHSIYLHPYMGEFAARTLCRNSISEFMCETGLNTGKAGMFTAVTTDGPIFDGVELRSNHGNALDFEGHLVNATLFGCNIHDNESAAFLEFTNTGQNTGTMIVDSTFTNNPSGVFSTPAAGVPALVQTGGGAVITANKMLWIRNTVTVNASWPFLFAGGNNTGPTNTITTWITQGVFGPDNTVH